MSSFPLERVGRLRRHTPLLPPPSFMQARRDNAILIGVSLLMMIVAGPAGRGRSGWVVGAVTRIVTTAYRYKRPHRKQKAGAIEALDMPATPPPSVSLAADRRGLDVRVKRIVLRGADEAA
jgi:hypothetical protein